MQFLSLNGMFIKKYKYLFSLVLILLSNSFKTIALSKSKLQSDDKKEYLYADKLIWSSKTRDLTLKGDKLIFNFENNNFKGTGSATFLINEKNILLDGKLMEKDIEIDTEKHFYKIERKNNDIILEKYDLKTTENDFKINSLSSINIQDSVLVRGFISWKDKKITGFPSNVFIKNLNDSNITHNQKVDSLGRFQIKLPKGKYSFSPKLNYHWVGEKFIRIDNEKSTIIVDTQQNLSSEVKIVLDTIQWPKNHQKVGLLNSKNIDFKKIDAFMNERMNFFEIPGASLSIIKDKKIIYTNEYGVTNSISKKSVSSKTLFEAGSITKLVFAFAVMRLYERDIIDLDKPLYQYLKHNQIDDHRYKSITARHVLSHQSGMPNWPKYNEEGKFKLLFKPGSKYGYSGKAYEYLKEVIESITSKSINDILNDEVLMSLGIEDMYFKGNEVIKKYGSNGHKNYKPSQLFLAKRPMVSYSLQTTSKALAKFALALQQRKGLKRKTYKEMFKVYSIRKDGTKWGLGVRIEESKLGTTYGHSGSTGRGFIGNLVFYDETGLGYAVLTNSQMGGFLSLPLLDEFLILGKTNWD